MVETLATEHPLGQESIEIFRRTFEEAGLGEDDVRRLNQRPSFPRILSQLIKSQSMEVIAPLGGRTHVVRIPVDMRAKWQPIVDAGETGRHLLPPDGSAEERKVILINFGEIISEKRVLDWMHRAHMESPVPQIADAIGVHNPELHHELGVKTLAVLTLGAYGPIPSVVWWGDHSNHDLGFGNRMYFECCWFALTDEVPRTGP